jgi:PST family polysaccharide transporter
MKIRSFGSNAAGAALVNIIKMILQLIMIPAMARLLSPEDYGLFALALPVVLFFVLLADGGLAPSLAKEDEANTIAWSTAFWLLLLSCTFFQLIVIGLGFLVANISGHPSLFGIIFLLSFSLPIMALTAPADARLMRRGNLLYHSIGDLSGSVTGAALALLMAYKGFGAWSLAFQYVSSFTVKAIILNANGWQNPLLKMEIRSVKSHLMMGGAIVSGRLGEMGGKILENALFGHFYGTTMLGSYNLANQLSQFSCNAFTNPIVGAFYARAIHLKNEEALELHLSVNRLMMFVLLPIAVLGAYLAPQLIPLILGEKWVQSACFVQILLIPYAFSAISWLAAQINIRNGGARKLATSLVSANMLRVGVISLGLFFTVNYVVLFVGVSYIAQAIIMNLRVKNVSFAHFLSNLRRSIPYLSCSVLAITSVYLCGELMTPNLAGIVLNTSLFFATYIAYLYIVFRRTVFDEANNFIECFRA